MLYGIALLLGCCSVTFAASMQDPFQTGNFALPGSQQPGPVFSFGQNIIDKNQTQLFVQADDYIGIQKHAIDVMPLVIYGISNNLSIMFALPYAPSYQIDHHHSADLEDAFAQLEYAIYKQQGKNYWDQATVVTSLSLPTGSALKNPPTGFGAPTLFVGATFSRMYSDWFVYVQPGVVLTTAHNNTRLGNQWLYEFGLGRNLFSVAAHWIVAVQAELDGTYANQNVIQGVTDTNSGGNVVYLTPSLFVSGQHLILQLGLGAPVTQHLYGNQTRNTWLAIANLGWTI